MTFSAVVLAALLQTRAPSDTVLALIAPQRGIFEYTSGILQILLLVLAAVMLVVMTRLMLTLRNVALKASKTVETLSVDVRPILKHASGIAEDTRETVARVRSDVEGLTTAAAAISDQLMNAADVTARRIDEVNAVLDVVQDELEQVTISSVAAVRGVRVGASEMVAALGGPANGGGRIRSGVRLELESRRRAMDAMDGDETE